MCRYLDKPTEQLIPFPICHSSRFSTHAAIFPATSEAYFKLPFLRRYLVLLTYATAVHFLVSLYIYFFLLVLVSHTHSSLLGLQWLSLLVTPLPRSSSMSTILCHWLVSTRPCKSTVSLCLEDNLTTQGKNISPAHLDVEIYCHQNYIYGQITLEKQTLYKGMYSYSKLKGIPASCGSLSALKTVFSCLIFHLLFLFSLLLVLLPTWHLMLFPLLIFLSCWE